METKCAASNECVSDNPLAPVGESVVRLDAYEKVIGEAQFADDIQFGPGLLHARIKRSPHPHAKILGIDYSKALALPGVKAVVTGESTPGFIGLYLKDRHVFCTDRVRFVGDPVAGVAAESEEIAEKALDLIDVQYEVLPAVFDPEYGASKEAPILHPEMGKYTVASFIFPQFGTNVPNHFKIRKGDVEKAFAEAAASVEMSFHIPHIQHVPIEPHAAVAKVDNEGRGTLWATSQSPFAQRSLMASCFDMSPADLTVIAPYVGGGFGCKAGVSMEALALAIAFKVRGRAVKLRLTREEEFHTSFVRQGLVSHFKMCCDKDGRMTGLISKMYWDAGAYAEYGVNMTRAAGYSSSGPYDVPNVQADSLCVYTNHPVGGPMRGFGQPEMQCGLEQCVNALANKIGIDPAEFRAINCVREGCTLVTGMKMHPTGLPQCIEKVREAINWGHKDPPSAPNKVRGKGMAIMWKAPATSSNPGSSAWIEMAEDGKLTLGLGGQELGQGTFTVCAQMAAATLGVPYDWVRLASPVNTKYSPYEWQTVASRLTWSMGNAVVAAAKDARRQILELCAEHWHENVEDLDLRNGIVTSSKSDKSQSIKDMVIYGLCKPGDQGWIGGPIIGRGRFMPTYITGLDPETGQGSRAVVHYTTGAQAVEIEIDKDTGRVEVLRGVAAFDMGKAINPDLVRVQLEGGLVQGISTAFFESLKLKNGVVQNPSFVDYRIATSADAPKDLQGIIVEVPQDDGPFGARGVGEHSMVPTIPAIANAIHDAIGIHPGAPPFTAEKVYLAMVDAGLVK